MKSKLAINSFIALSFTMTLSCFGSARGEVLDVGSTNSKGVALTVYNQNFGLVKDTRTVNLKGGFNYLRFSDVASAIDPTTVNFLSLTAPNAVTVREQNYQYDILSPESILNKSVGKQITFRQFLSGGQERSITGTLLNSPQVTVVDTNGNASQRSQGLVVGTDSGVVLRPYGQVELKDLPQGLVSKPSLLWKLETSKPGEHRTEISYQTAGLNWRCDYVIIASDDDTTADITSWVTLDNKSGTGYKNALLKLMAGDVHRIQPPMPRRRMEKFGGIVAATTVAPQFSEKSFAEYHLYSLAGTTNVNNNETKQLSLFNAAKIPCSKLFIYEGEPGGYYRPNQHARSKKVNVKIEIANTEKNNMGLALPKGKVRVYKRDHDGALQFVGEDLIDHTPRDEKIRLYIGDAFDVVGERKRTNYQRPSSRVERSTYEISLRNHKDTKVLVTAIEHSHSEWKILSSNFKSTKKDATSFEFPVEVPARGEVKITYEIEVRT